MSTILCAMKISALVKPSIVDLIAEHTDFLISYLLQYLINVPNTEEPKHQQDNNIGCKPVLFDVLNCCIGRRMICNRGKAGEEEEEFSNVFSSCEM